MRVWVMVVLAGVVAGGALGQTLPGGAGTQAGGGKWEGVVGRLSSEDFKVREGAQKELAGATWRELGGLKELAGRAGDAEVKVRVEKRVEELEEEVAMSPPPVSVDFRGARLKEVCAAFSRETGTEWRYQSEAGADWTYTLQATDRPLWEVYLSLNQQHEISVVRDMGFFRVNQWRGVLRGDVEGGFLFYPEVFSRQLDVQRGSKEEMVLGIGLMTDPRINLASCFKPRVMSVVNETGKEVYKAEGPGSGDRNSGRGLIFDTEARWPAVEGMGRRVDVKGVMKVVAVIGVAEVEVADVEKQGEAPVAVAGERVVFKTVEAGEERGSLRMEVEVAGGTKGEELGPVEMMVVDAKGKQVWNMRMRRDEMVSGTTDGGERPMKAVLRGAARVKEVEVPFVFKDLPVP